MGLTPRLLKTTTLNINSKNTDGYWNDDGDWVEGTDIAPIPVTGSLQPFKQGESLVDLPSGISSTDVRIFYTKVYLKSANEYTNQEADRTTINNIPYLCYNIENWATHGLNSDNYKVFFVREDKMDGN